MSGKKVIIRLSVDAWRLELAQLLAEESYMDVYTWHRILIYNGLEAAREAHREKTGVTFTPEGEPM